MNTREQVVSVLTALSDVLGPIRPLSAALWLLSTMVMACLLVFGWQRLARRSGANE